MINCGGTRRLVGLKPSPCARPHGVPDYWILTPQVNYGVRCGGTHRRVEPRLSACYLSSLLCAERHTVVPYTQNLISSPFRFKWHNLHITSCRERLSCRSTPRLPSFVKNPPYTAKPNSAIRAGRGAGRASRHLRFKSIPAFCLLFLKK